MSKLQHSCLQAHLQHGSLWANALYSMCVFTEEVHFSTLSNYQLQTLQKCLSIETESEEPEGIKFAVFGKTKESNSFYFS